MRSINTAAFIDYVFSFYGPNQLYGEFFDNTLTRREVRKATALLLTLDRDFAGDSFDREMCRDILFKMRGKHDGLEYGRALDGLKI